MRSLNRQRGVVLFLALIMLVMMTLFAVSSVNLGTVNLKIVGNMQAMKMMDADAQDAIEQVISDMNNFGLSTSATTITTPNGTVDVTALDCIDSQTATGYSAVVGSIIPEDNVWEISATITDNVTGAVSTVHQGVEIRMLAGNCP
jgi:Tfp pilus assembly protein PilX